MKPFNLCFRLFIYLAIALTIGHPTLPLAATDFLQSQEISRSNTFLGRLENGLNYTFIPSSKLKGGGSWIKLTCSIPDEEEISSISLLTQHVLFYGTKQMDRQYLASQLDALGFDIEADSYLQSNQSEKILQFSLPNSKTETVRKLLGMLHQMAFFPTLKMEDIELARNHLLSKGEHSEKEALNLQCVTAVQLQKFHTQWYRPEHMHLTLIGFDNPQEILSLLSDTFNSPIQFHESLPSQEELPLPLNEEDTLASSLTERVEWTQDNQSLVVDGKIWMKEPNWINKSSNGKTLGAILTILGIGGMILAIPIVAPLAIIAGSLTTLTGTYFLTSAYLKDPYYVESILVTVQNEKKNRKLLINFVEVIKIKCLINNEIEKCFSLK
jgi:hypothetical protein